MEWHLIEGRTSGLTGRVWLANPKDPLSVQASIEFPVARFNTEGEMRDERMREVMDSTHSPHVTLLVESLKPECTPATFKSVGRCGARVSTRLKIRGVEQPLEIHAELVTNQREGVLRGETRCRWADFGVEDPSILVARLDPEVVITYSVTIPNAING
jgi:polyisoprenoid-binding protein YceI